MGALKTGAEATIGETVGIGSSVEVSKLLGDGPFHAVAGSTVGVESAVFGGAGRSGVCGWIDSLAGVGVERVRLPDGAISGLSGGVSAVFECGLVVSGEGAFVLDVGFVLEVGLGGEFPRRRLPAGKMFEASGVRLLFDGGLVLGGWTGGCGRTLAG